MKESWKYGWTYLVVFLLGSLLMGSMAYEWVVEVSQWDSITLPGILRVIVTPPLLLLSVGAFVLMWKQWREL